MPVIRICTFLTAAYWPHTTESNKPDDARLFDLLDTWSGDKAIRERILVANAATLYDFPTQADPALTA